MLSSKRSSRSHRSKARAYKRGKKSQAFSRCSSNVISNEILSSEWAQAQLGQDWPILVMGQLGQAQRHESDVAIKGQTQRSFEDPVRRNLKSLENSTYTHIQIGNRRPETTRKSTATHVSPAPVPRSTGESCQPQTRTSPMAVVPSVHYARVPPSRAPAFLLADRNTCPALGGAHWASRPSPPHHPTAAMRLAPLSRIAIRVAPLPANQVAAFPFRRIAPLHVYKLALTRLPESIQLVFSKNQTSTEVAVVSEPCLQ